MAELYRRWSPYNYVENDPIRLTDPDGMSLPGFQTQDDDPEKEKKGAQKASQEWGLMKGQQMVQETLERMGHGGDNQLMSGQWGSEQQPGGDPKSNKTSTKGHNTSTKAHTDAPASVDASEKQKVDPFGTPVLWFGVAGLIMENSKFANVASNGSKIGVTISALSIINDSKKKVAG